LDIWIILGYNDFDPKNQLEKGTIAGPRFSAQTLVHGKLSQKEFLHHVKATAIAQMEKAMS